MIDNDSMSLFLRKTKLVIKLGFCALVFFCRVDDNEIDQRNFFAQDTI